MTDNEQRCPEHRIRDCAPLLNGCSWRPGAAAVTPPAQDGLAFRSGADREGDGWLHDTVPAAPSVSTDIDKRGEHEQRAFKHYDDVGDGGATYFQFHGWVLTCYSCGWDARGETKEQALRHMQEHYDRVTAGTEFRVTVRRG